MREGKNWAISNAIMLVYHCLCQVITRSQGMMETIREKEEIEQEESGIREWTEEYNDKIGNICDPYNKL